MSKDGPTLRKTRHGGRHHCLHHCWQNRNPFYENRSTIDWWGSIQICKGLDIFHLKWREGRVSTHIHKKWQVGENPRERKVRMLSLSGLGTISSDFTILFHLIIVGHSFSFFFPLFWFLFVSGIVDSNQRRKKKEKKKEQKWEKLTVLLYIPFLLPCEWVIVFEHKKKKKKTKTKSKKWPLVSR